MLFYFFLILLLLHLWLWNWELELDVSFLEGGLLGLEFINELILILKLALDWVLHDLALVEELLTEDFGGKV